MDQKDHALLQTKDEIFNAFRPIEQLFKIMDTSSVEIYGQLTRSYADVGITLCQNFRQHLDAILTAESGGNQNDHR
ncbi:hypothetical protein [Solidesulfovibrio magneticus]|uniref:Uncharacterized protein n=1 Tax=Solidesulfovibrio magneticus (strain ATCC 700980 / DSM 13731 / RS-1) TaxID=573370 RepID=C4XKU5_SOLM1|nr:hypothetical protein [Solidesulfovibrio magneticus]BAH74484.1 hypothetical protein DMR_09930 [Solidesulfovibrio magneticus RS-1]